MKQVKHFDKMNIHHYHNMGREGKRTPEPCWGSWINLYFFFPQPLVDGFSKLWLRGKGNLRVETLIPAGSMPGFMPARAHAQKQQYLQGFSHAWCKHSNIYKDF